MFGNPSRPRRVTPDPNATVALPAPPNPVGGAGNRPQNPVELPVIAPPKMRYANPMASGSPHLAAPAMPVPEMEAEAALPTFTNKYDEMKWRGGVDYGGRGGDPMQRAEWEHMTRGGKMNPTQPTGKDRLREALMVGLYGIAQGAATTGTISGALAGGGTAAAVGAFSPETARAMTFEPQRQQLMQRQREGLDLQGDMTRVEGLKAGLEGTRMKTKETVADMQIKEAMSKADLDARAQKMILDAALNQAQVGNQTSQAGQHDAQAALYGVQAGERIAKLPGEIGKQQMSIALDRAKQAEIRQRIAESQAKTPYEIARIKAQVDSEYAQAENIRERTYGQRQSNQGGDFTEEGIAEFARVNGMSVMQAKRQLRGAGYVLPKPIE